MDPLACFQGENALGGKNPKRFLQRPMSHAKEHAPFADARQRLVDLAPRDATAEVIRQLLGTRSKKRSSANLCAHSSCV